MGSGDMDRPPSIADLPPDPDAPAKCPADLVIEKSPSVIDCVAPGDAPPAGPGDSGGASLGSQLDALYTSLENAEEAVDGQHAKMLSARQIMQTEREQMQKMKEQLLAMRASLEEKQGYLNKQHESVRRLHEELGLRAGGAARGFLQCWS
mmetsp:Transcript_92071/g.260632  ORF Transcript_92071/g.260632 Transcript_92071/m.260632 type:complete len:150 (+) Transcript_92071:171-620(+)